MSEQYVQYEQYSMFTNEQYVFPTSELSRVAVYID